jgi:hypothetical protein
MYLFKTSGATIENVVKYEKHAFKYKPREWNEGELVLVSKNRKDLKNGEKQIQYIMKIKDVREANPGEIDKYWPGCEGKWKYIIECYGSKKLKNPFNLEDVIGNNFKSYSPIVTFKKVEHYDEEEILNWLRKHYEL